MSLLLSLALTSTADARPFDTADATTVGARTVQVEAGADLGTDGVPVPSVGVGAGLSNRVDLVVGAALDDVAVGGKWLVREGSPQGQAGPSLALEAGASPLAREAGGVVVASQQWPALAVHLAADAAVVVDGSVGAGAGLAVDLIPNAVVRPAAEVRLDGRTPSALAAIVVTPAPAWMLDVAVLASESAQPMVRAGVTWAISTERRAEPVADVAAEPDEEAGVAMY